ncbi:sigma 54-interacting transcriptional regulator [Acaryochloris marina]|uniref:Nitrogen regulatory protein, putative n=1 Tax=Acaryochloris marina (strain MBIC 11017) TaxID=329726 RepID=B0CG61_ACAM1|nr:sigma 54-interacting transcriptional regulator [Acaryochloris marina]ABW30614.1 nitrogen regulatory protein, putative [Acaryochloris marina MBIC11017]BDM79404.1 ATPase AAA [Acaryochloris marina MBIC10699]
MASSEDKKAWLQEHTDLNIFPEKILDRLARKVKVQTLEANRRLILEDTLPDAVYILRQGHLESYHTSLVDTAQVCSLLPGAVLHLFDILLEQPTLQTIITLTDCEFWVISKKDLLKIAGEYQDVTRIVSQKLSKDLAHVSRELEAEQERQAILRPYLVPRVNRGIVGSSRYAKRLREQLKEAACTRHSVIIFGEPGLEKDNAAALIHFGSNQRREPMVKINCNTLQISGADLFGRVGGKPGLLEAVGEGTVLLNNIQDLPPVLCPKLRQLLETQTYLPVQRDGTAAKPRTSNARLIFTAEKIQPELDGEIFHRIKMPPLRVSKADVEAQVEYYISLLSKEQGFAKRQLTPEALRRLQSYNYPGNIVELHSLVERAIAQSSPNEDLTAEIFWAAQDRQQRFRLNLLNANPWLRRFLRSPWWPTRINYGIVLPLFIFVVIILFVGPQQRSQNFALNLFWAWWWPLILIGFPFVGRLWCSVCPFMICGELLQKLSLWLVPRQLQRWPRQQAEQWGGWFLFGLFALIFLWEELWNLEDTAYLSSCLLLLITAGAVICSQIFERRFWCRYLCPIGGMNGLFAKLSMTELRAQQGTCSAECSTYQCYKGGPEKGEGQETDGCPLYSHPAQLEDNRDCVLCMTCLQACPHRSVEFNLRPPGIELWTTHTPRIYEVALLLLLLGGIFLHRLPELQAWLGLDFHLQQFSAHLLVSVLVLGIAALIPLLTHTILCRISTKLKPRPFIELVYGYLPLVLGGTLAHYLRLGLTEAGQILPVTWVTFGFSGVGLPIWVAHPAVVSFLQGSTILTAIFLTWVLTQKIARQPITVLLPQHMTSLGLGFCLWSVIVGV